MAKRSLGRGLGAILEDVELAYKAELNEGNSDIVKDIDLDLIVENPYQPRKNFDETALRELSESIKRHGLIQPIIVIEKDGGYMLIAGERRFRATKLLGESKIKGYSRRHRESKPARASAHRKYPKRRLKSDRACKFL